VPLFAGIIPRERGLNAGSALVGPDDLLTTTQLSLMLKAGVIELASTSLRVWRIGN